MRPLNGTSYRTCGLDTAWPKLPRADFRTQRSSTIGTEAETRVISCVMDNDAYDPKMVLVQLAAGITCNDGDEMPSVRQFYSDVELAQFILEV